MTAAIITARGGSRRLPRKNVKDFCGHPLVAWAIVQARASHLIDSVFVSTDDDEIQMISEQYGAEVIRRPNWPDANECAANRPFIHAIKEIVSSHPATDTVLTILPTNPLNLPGDFDKGIQLYRQYGCDYICPLIPKRETIVLRKTHPARARNVLFDKRYNFLGQAGGWIVTSPQWYVSFNSEISDLDADLDKMENWPSTECYFFPVEVWQTADVDTAAEFELAELMMEHYILKGRGMNVYEEYEKSKPISPPDNLGKYAGNLNQQ